ncbi:hypothetical protein COOONC_13889 [Cooperia oncophora]
MENALGDVRSLLLETLLQRLKTDSVVAKDSRSVEETAKLVREEDLPKVEESVPSLSIEKSVTDDDTSCTVREELDFTGTFCATSTTQTGQESRLYAS